MKKCIMLLSLLFLIMYIIMTFSLKEDFRNNIEKSYNQLDTNNLELPFIKPAKIKRITPNNISVCSIDKQYIPYKHYTPKIIKNTQNYKTIINKKNETTKNKKYYENHYGSILAPKEIIPIQEEENKTNHFTQGNICKLSKWSLWSNCDASKCINNKIRTRKVLKTPSNCYSPLNPVLKQNISCDSNLCF